MKQRLSATVLGIALAFTWMSGAEAGVVVYEKDGKKIEVGGRIQLQYLHTDALDEENRDQVFFRRLRPYIAGTVTESWWGKIQVDFGKSLDGDEVAVRDAYMQYKGWDNTTLTLGNSKTPFSREFLTSSLRQQTVERGFVGDHNFGTPDRQLGVRLEGHTTGKTVGYMLAAGGQHHDPDARRMDFDSPVNNQEDWNEGLVVAGRIDFHPWGHVKRDQGDFHTDGLKASFSLAFFSWSNDGDVNTYTDPASGLGTSSSKADLDGADGFEVSAGLRGRGVSIDAEFHLVSADTVDPTFTGGIYRDGATELDKLQIEGGYMLPGNRFELVGKWETLDADNYEEAWEAWEIGLNYFWNRHKVKAQLTYRHGENTLGVLGDEADTTFLQLQYVF